MQRILFGDEKTGLSMSVCPDCKVKRGQLHVLGCSFESCDCGNPLIYCTCQGLNDDDALQAVVNIAEGMTAAEASQAGSDNKTYFGAAVMAAKLTWMAEHGTPRARTRIKELLKTGAVQDTGQVLIMSGLPVRNNPPPAWHDLTGGEA